MEQPAASIINSLGGPAIVAGVTGVHRTVVWKWRTPRDRGGTGGLIPQKHIPVLLAYATKIEVKLSASDFLPRQGEAA